MTSLDRPLSAAIGLGVLGFAALLLGSPAVERRVPIARAVAWSGNDYVLVAPIAVLALAGAIVVLAARGRAGVVEATPPAVEGVAPDPAGRDVDETLDALPPVRVTSDHRRIHDRLREAAIASVAGARGCSRATARKLIERGEWADDADAASFVGSARLEPPSVGRRIAVRLLGDHWFRRRVEATVASLEAVGGDER